MVLGWVPVDGGTGDGHAREGTHGGEVGMIRRWLAWVLAVALLAFGLLWPAIFGAGPARGTHRDPAAGRSTPAPSPAESLPT